MRRLANVLLLIAIGLTAHAQSIGQGVRPWRSMSPQIRHYSHNDGPTRNLADLTNQSCAPIPGIDSTILAYMAEYGIVGAQLAVMRGDSLLYVKGYGYADRVSGEEMEAWHRMRIASVSKLVTAVGIMKLRDMGLLKLEDKVFAPGGVLASYSSNADPRFNDITIEHLLRHQAGFTAKVEDPLFCVGFLDGRQTLRKELSHPLAFTPGSSQEYSNVGFFALSVVIEEITGKAYEDWMQQNVLFPMQCYNFRIGGNYLDERYPGEVRYHMHPGSKTDEDYHGGGIQVEKCYGSNNVRATLGAGGWITTAAELCRMVAGIDGDWGIGDILSEDSIARMTQFVSPDVYSLGWNDTNQVGIWTRTGSFSGTTALIRNYSWDGDCWVLLTNTSTRHASRIVKYSSAMIMELRARYWYDLGNRDLFHWSAPLAD